MGRNLKVEPIRDVNKKSRVRVPERMVSYVAGVAKKTSDGRTNTMRRIAHMEPNNKKGSNKGKKKQCPKKNQQQPPSNIYSNKKDENRRTRRNSAKEMDMFF
jgi:hypothetical protein